MRSQLEAMAADLNIGELVVNTITWDHAKRLKSYELLAYEFELSAAEHADPTYLPGPAATPTAESAHP